MSANVDEGARKLGEKLLAEIELEDLSSVGDPMDVLLLGSD